MPLARNPDDHLNSWFDDPERAWQGAGRGRIVAQLDAAESFQVHQASKTSVRRKPGAAM
ncbi:MAG: hypothetical protein O2971_18045 [Proteobacteria bacterium]|nr:hypothetical protein [Pseudomonadota bacterium]